MLQKFLKDAMVIAVGKQGEDIVDLLDGKKYVNEFLIAKKFGATINQTRNILYKLLDFGLISSIRKKDKKKGWYTYFWKIETLKTLEFLREFLTKRIEQIEHNIKSRETKQFYFCERCNVEYTEENALLHNFTCPECGSLLNLKDNTKIIDELKREAERVKRQRALLDEDINEEKNKIGKARQKEMRKEEEMKKEEKRKKAIKKKREEARLNKKTGKKENKKSPKKEKKSKSNSKKIKKKK